MEEKNNEIKQDSVYKVSTVNSENHPKNHNGYPENFPLNSLIEEDLDDVGTDIYHKEKRTGIYDEEEIEEFLDEIPLNEESFRKALTCNTDLSMDEVLAQLKFDICYNVCGTIYSNEVEVLKDEKFICSLIEIYVNFNENYAIKGSKNFCKEHHGKSFWELVVYTTNIKELKIDFQNFSFKSQRLLEKPFSDFLHEYRDSKLINNTIENLIPQMKQKYEYLAKNYEEYISS